MFKFLFFVLLMILGLVAFFWFGSQSTPSWVQQEEVTQEANLVRLSSQIEQQGVANFLGDKFADVMRGEVVLSEDEFNAVLQASLAGHEDGRRLLRVSDVVRARLSPNELEIGAVINLAKVRREEPKAREAIEEALAVLPFDVGESVFVALRGEPVARNGQLGVKENISVQLGAIPLSAGFLKSLGVPTERIEQESIPLRLLNLKSVQVEQGQIRLGVRPRF